MIVKIKQENRHIFDRLAQHYEAEFSPITQKFPDENGLFALDTLPENSVEGYIWFEDNCPAGFILIDLEKQPFNVNEFFVFPCYRNQLIGEKFFFNILNMFPGSWQVKQLPAAVKAKNFWRKAISKYTEGNYEEDLFNDPYWGTVTRQTFIAKKIR